ncbi:MAG: hypothetical protein U9R40_04630, partial [Synergistota bacterium]|nr:hypothetical protein [Synergistota bacterium]
MITQRAARTIPEGGWQRITSLNTGSGSAWEKQIRRLLAVMRDFREVVSVVKTVKMVLVPLILLALSVSPLLCAEREIVAQSEKDLDLDGCTETVAVEMASGERIVETEPGPF